jgi:NADH:ubiquinone oxidoreductase subunit 6 (subunit J)
MLLLSTEFFIKNLMIISLIFSYVLTTTKNAIYSALSLIVIILCTSIILWFVGAEFLAMMYIIVYLGAIAVLFLFVVMMLNIDIKKNEKFKFFKNFFKVIKILFFNFRKYLAKLYAILYELRIFDDEVYKPLPAETYLESNRILHVFTIFIWAYFLFTDAVLLVTATPFTRHFYSALGTFTLLNYFMFYVFKLNKDVPNKFNRKTVVKNVDFSFIFDLFYYILFTFAFLIILFTPIDFFKLNNNLLEQNNIFLDLISSNYLHNTAIIGELLYFEYGFLFILSSFILLIAMIGTILITLKKDTISKKQFISKQINRNLNKTVSFYKVTKVTL